MSNSSFGGEAHEPLDLPRLKRLFGQGPEEEAEAAVGALLSLGTRLVPVLRELLADLQADVRWWAVRALAEVEDPAAHELILEALKDPDLAIRQCAALVLRKRPFPESVPALQALLESGDRLSARLAADALGAIGPSATEALLETLAGAEQQARVEAIRALALSDDLRAVPALFAGLDDGSPIIEHWADIGLQRRGIGMTFFKP